MTTLTTLCLEQLATDICNAPPVIKDMVVDKTTTKITNKNKTDIKQKVTAAVCNINTTLIPDIINIISNNNYSLPLDMSSRMAIECKFSDIDPYVLDTAIEVADSIAIFYNMKHVCFYHGSRNEMDCDSSDSGDY
jgi:hypothetical protein